MRVMMEIHGKIYVVALVLAIIFAGLGLFLFYLERKISGLEKKADMLEKENADNKK